jgi:hemin uptake protein HemP
MTDALPPSDSPPAEPAPPQPTLPQPTLPQPTLPAREQWTSAELLGERTEVLIVHNNEVYRLRRTRQDKLILYK